MATARYNLTTAWSSSNRITAAENTAILITKDLSSTVYFAITSDDTQPSFDPEVAHLVGNKKEDNQVSLEIKTGERIWFAASEADSITVTSGTA